MTQPTLNDVLDAVTRLDAQVDLHRAESAKAFAGVDAQIDVLRVEVDAKLDVVRADIARSTRTSPAIWMFTASSTRRSTR